jgi:hypothetical protein
MESSVLLEVLKERTELVKKLDRLITRFFSSAGQHDRIRRGAAQDLILTALKLPKTNTNRALINERMAEKGYKPVINRGDQYYNHITHRVSKAYGSHQ